MSEKLKKIAHNAKNDFYYFCKNILGFSKMSPVPHKELCEFALKKSKRKKLILMPRGSFKSTVVTVGLPLFKLVHNPNLRILVAGATQKNSKKFVKEIRTHLETNDRFKAIFGNWKNDDVVWREDEFTIARRTSVKKESSVMASSLEKQTITGLHFDLIILDDPVDMSNINTPEQMQKTIDFYKMLLSILEPDGEIIVVGTRYSVMDLYGYLSDELSPERDTIDILIKEAIDDDGNLLMPDVLSREFLEEQRKSQGSFIFSCQYLNRAVSPDTCYFKHEDILFYENLPKGLIYFITFDPAISKKERSDYSAFIVNGVDYLHNWFIAEAIQLKLSPQEIVEKIFQLVDQYNPQLVAMEKYTLEQVLKINLEQEMLRRQKFFPLKELPTDNRIAKENRIRALQPRFASKQIYIHPTQKALHHQIAYYPMGVKNDDLLDALKSQLQVTYPSPNVVEKSIIDYPTLSYSDRERWKTDMKTAARYVKQRRHY